MGPTVAIVGLILLAVLVGAVIPVLYQASQTLKSARQQIDALGPRVDRALLELTEVTGRLNRIAGTIEQQGERLKPLVDEAAGIGRTIGGLRESVRKAGTVLGAVAPALAAGLTAFMALRRRGGDSEPEPADAEEEPVGAAPRPRPAATEDEHGH